MSLNGVMIGMKLIIIKMSSKGVMR
jgi:hypothetical protein